MSSESLSQFEQEVDNENEEYLIRCIVDTSCRKFTLFSNLGDKKTIQCETIDQFMNVLGVVRASIDENNIAEVSYSNPL
jgi:hypothetical protein